MILSIVIPAFNEAGRINRAVAETHKYFSSLKLEFEIVVIDDGSSDETAALIQRLDYKNLRKVRNKKI